MSIDKSSNVYKLGLIAPTLNLFIYLFIISSSPIYVAFQEDEASDVEASIDESGDALNIKRSVITALKTYTMPSGYHRIEQVCILSIHMILFVLLKR